MTSVPLHPALVHIPLGLALLLPAFALSSGRALWKNHLQQRVWLAIVLLLSVLLGAGFLAMSTGNSEEKRVEAAVPKAALETHEEYAEQFLWTTGGTLVVAALVLMFRKPAAVRVLTAATVLGTFVVAATALRVGHAGGQLVYVHNAAATYSLGNQINAANRSQASAAALEKSPLTPGEDD